MTKYIVLFFLLITSSALARLGENEVACALRYNHGQDIPQTPQDRTSPLVTGVNTTNKTYIYQGWRIRIGFINGIAHRVEYSDAEKSNHKITDEETVAILAANGGLNAWKPVTKKDFTDGSPISKYLFTFLKEKSWMRSDRAIAQIKYPGTTMCLESYNILKSELGNQKKVEKKAIPEF